jgi:hypothetical protein
MPQYSANDNFLVVHSFTYTRIVLPAPAAILLHVSEASYRGQSDNYVWHGSTMQHFVRFPTLCIFHDQKSILLFQVREV